MYAATCSVHRSVQSLTYLEHDVAWLQSEAWSEVTLQNSPNDECCFVAAASYNLPFIYIGGVTWHTVSCWCAVTAYRTARTHAGSQPTSNEWASELSSRPQEARLSAEVCRILVVWVSIPSCQRTLSWNRRILSQTSISWRFILILSSYLPSGLQSGVSFPILYRNARLPYPMLGED
jgi:hypothetical protein